jgi:MOSC domain-containing protein YiiM
MEVLQEEKAFVEFFDNFVQTGEIIWIGIHPESRQPVLVLEETFAQIGGLKDDRFNKGNPESKRQVTLIQYEHLQAVASFLGKENIDPSLVRRNLLVKGINLNSMRGRQIRIGEAILEMTGYCPPCRRMEENLGKGGYNAMRGHGGINCRVLKEGKIRVGDRVEVVKTQEMMEF